jgi:hypothetical protein
MIVNFSYSGRGGPDFAGTISNGSGSFSFAERLSSIGLSDLSSFNFTLNENTPDTTTFGLSDLTSFSAFVSSGPSLTVLALVTDPVQGSNQETEPREFGVSSLSPGGAYSNFLIHFLDESFQLTTGSVTINSIGPNSVPEPSTFTPAVVGAQIVLGAWSRRRNVHARAPAPGSPPQR